MRKTYVPIAQNLSTIHINQQEFKGELSRQERYDIEKEELLQDSSIFTIKIKPVLHDVPNKNALICL